MVIFQNFPEFYMKIIISIENATYFQNLQDSNENLGNEQNEDLPNFEVDSIELATPELFSNDTTNVENEEKKEPEIFENFTNENKNEEENEIKEPEMFEESNAEEDFEIPAFLRRQKN